MQLLSGLDPPSKVWWDIMSVPGEMSRTIKMCIVPRDSKEISELPLIRYEHFALFRWSSSEQGEMMILETKQSVHTFQQCWESDQKGGKKEHI